MAEEKKPRKPKNPSPLIGAQAVPTTLNKTNKLDIDVDKHLIDDMIEAGLSGKLDIGALENFTSISNSREQIYQLIDTMTQDSTVSSIIRTYTEDVCEASDNGHIVWCESDDPKISKFVNYLLNIMNVDKNIFSWVYSLIKYGDVYLRLFRESDYKDTIFKPDHINAAANARTSLNESAKVDEAVRMNIHPINDPYSYYVEMVPDPGTMFDLTKFGKTYGFIETPNAPLNTTYTNSYFGTTTNDGLANYRMKSNDVNIYQADDFVHASLEDNYSRFPESVQLFTNEADYEAGTNAQTYNVKRGKSLLYDSYKIWREKSLLENAVLLNRVTRSSVVRTVQVECGDMSKTQVQNTLRRVKELMEQRSAINTGNGMSEYTNPGPVENNIYLATHNGQGAVTISALGGDVEVKNLADLDNWTNKFYSSYGIPKQYFGWTDDGAGFNGGASLSIISSVYAKGVKRVQNSILQAITDAVNLMLVNRGCHSYLNNFVLKMKTPLTQEEKDYRDDLVARVNAVSNLQSLFSDVEDKARRLEILKSLIKTLNYGDAMMQIIDDEIEAVKKAQAEEKEQAEADNAAGNTEISSGGPSAANEEPEDLDLDLGTSDIAPVAEESFNKPDNLTTLVEGPDFLTDDNLPTPEEADESIDFSKNR